MWAPLCTARSDKCLVMMMMVRIKRRKSEIYVWLYDDWDDDNNNNNIIIEHMCVLCTCVCGYLIWLGEKAGFWWRRGLMEWILISVGTCLIFLFFQLLFNTADHFRYEAGVEEAFLPGAGGKCVCTHAVYIITMQISGSPVSLVAILRLNLKNCERVCVKLEMGRIMILSVYFCTNKYYKWQLFMFTRTSILYSRVA